MFVEARPVPGSSRFGTVFNDRPSKFFSAVSRSIKKSGRLFGFIDLPVGSHRRVLA